MRYENVYEGRFLLRPNRFIALVDLEGETRRCHVPNTGRLRELLLPGVRAWCQFHPEPGRKTAWTLIAVERDGVVVNLDSQAPNHVAEEFLPRLFPSLLHYRREVTWGRSRFDFFVETAAGPWFMEVKGVTLEEDCVALFPDAPTQRGVKHLEELCRCQEEGFRACVLFVVQMADVKCFCPNRQTDPDFAAALEEAAACGVDIRVMDCLVTPDSMTIRNPVPVEL